MSSEQDKNQTSSKDSNENQNETQQEGKKAVNKKGSQKKDKNGSSASAQQDKASKENENEDLDMINENSDNQQDNIDQHEKDEDNRNQSGENNSFFKQSQEETENQNNQNESNLQRRLSSRKRKEKHIDDMDFGYRKAVTPVKKIKKSKSADPKAKKEQPQKKKAPQVQKQQQAQSAQQQDTSINQQQNQQSAQKQQKTPIKQDKKGKEVKRENKTPIKNEKAEKTSSEGKGQEQKSESSVKRDNNKRPNLFKKTNSSALAAAKSNEKKPTQQNQSSILNYMNNSASKKQKDNLSIASDLTASTEKETKNSKNTVSKIKEQMKEKAEKEQLEQRSENKKHDKIKQKEIIKQEKLQKKLEMKIEKEERDKKKAQEKLEKEQQQLEEQMYKKEKKEKLKKNPNKRIFNPQEYNENLKKKIQLEGQLQELYDQYGRKLEKVHEPKQNQTHWDYILQEIHETAEYFQKRRSYFKFQTRKIAKHSVTALSNLRQSKEQKIKEEAKRIKKIAESCNQMVQRYFWRSMHKVKKFMKVIEYQKEQKEDQQKRLENLVSEQWQLSMKLAKLLQLTKDIPELDTQKAVEESKAKSNQRDLEEKQKQEAKEEEQAKQEEEEIQDQQENKLSAEEEEKLKQEQEQQEQLAKKLQEIKREQEEIEKELKRIEELENELLSNEELAKEYNINIQLKRDGLNNYTFDKMLYSKINPSPVQSANDLAPQLQEIEEEEEEEELDKYGNIKLPFHDFEPQAITLNDATIVQPFLLKGRLREYQLIGQNWLATLQQKKMNGILADEMGLGKTIQTISLLAHLACNKGIWGPHLIIVPTSILINWEIEFKKWCPAFKIMTYYGSPKERKLKRAGWSKMNHFQVCITSYKIALQDQKIFRRKKWYFMVLDEAQHIKNFKSQRWQVLLNFHTKHRLLLTGTPLQNDVGELWSLLHFLMPRIFDSHSDFMEWFSIPMQQALQKNLPISQEILKKLHSILRPFLLRRLKKDVEKQLPTKTEYIIKCPLSRRQRYLYDEFISRDDTKNSMKQQDFLGLMNIVMQLKKVCNHPDLFEARTIESPFSSMKLKLVVLSHFLYSTKSRIPFKLDFINNELNKTAYNIQRAKSLMPIADDFYEMNNVLFSEENWPSYIPYYAQRWRILKQFTKQQSLKRLYKSNRARIQSDHVVYGIDTIDFLTVKQARDPYIEMSEFKTLTFEQALDSVRVLINEFSFAQRAIAEPPEVIITPFDSEKNNYYQRFNKTMKQQLSVVAKEFHYCHIRRTLCFPSKKLLMYDCGKLNTMIQLLKKLKQRGDKVLIFTQMSRMLDIFENVLNLFNFTYVRLDGSTKIENRQKVVERFNGDSRIFCFISSTRSGGIGLNLTGANVVVFYDTDWNPAMDRQAQDRCHRIGQTRNVSIYRLISEYTIEENILLKSIQKRKLDEYIMEEGMFNTQFYEKFDVRGILGGMLGQAQKKQEDNIDKSQMEKILEKVEDKEDTVALKKAQMEEIEYVTEGAAEVAAMDKDDEEQKEKQFSVDVQKFPPIFQYGLKYIKNEEQLHQNDGEDKFMDDDLFDDDLDEEDEDEEEENEEEKIKQTPIEEDDEEFVYENENSAKKDDDEDEDENNSILPQRNNNPSFKQRGLDEDDEEEEEEDEDEEEENDKVKEDDDMDEEDSKQEGYYGDRNKNKSPSSSPTNKQVKKQSFEEDEEEEDESNEAETGRVRKKSKDSNKSMDEEDEDNEEEEEEVEIEIEENDSDSNRKQNGYKQQDKNSPSIQKSSQETNKNEGEAFDEQEIEEEIESNKNSVLKSGKDSSKVKKKVRFLDQVEVEVEKQAPPPPPASKSSKNDEEEDDEENENEDIEDDDEEEDVEEEDKFNDEDRKNSLRI
ncbi:SNF2 family amine-terminal protein, partial (macronuclear) [Tetrahymena thermophila SB210]